MKRLEETLAALKSRKEGAFMPFLVIGDPDPETARDLANALLEAGSDILEFGFPFSDPPADGPAIQLADQRALKAGVTTEKAFGFLESLRKSTDVPFTLLLYYNLILQYGVEAFYERASKAGVDAILVADLPIEEAAEALTAAETHNIAPIFIVSELTSAARLEQMLPAARGYLYLVTHLGVTGARTSMQDNLPTVITSLAGKSSMPLLAGFGISKPEHVKTVLQAGADGAIVGSALIKLIETNLGNKTAMLTDVRSLASQLKTATRP